MSFGSGIHYCLKHRTNENDSETLLYHVFMSHGQEDSFYRTYNSFSNEYPHLNAEDFDSFFTIFNNEKGNADRKDLNVFLESADNALKKYVSDIDSSIIQNINSKMDGKDYTDRAMSVLYIFDNQTQTMNVRISYDFSIPLYNGNSILLSVAVDPKDRSTGILSARMIDYEGIDFDLPTPVSQQYQEDNNLGSMETYFSIGSWESYHNTADKIYSMIIDRWGDFI